MLERRIRRRLIATKSAGFCEYLDYLENNQNEIDNLLDVLTINVSMFFRDNLTFEYLKKEIIPSIISEKTIAHDNSLRIWSAGCSTGEESYSMAILINESIAKETPWLISYIIATDIDKKALQKAQEAVYPFESIKDIKYWLLNRYFTREKDCFKLVPEIKKIVNLSVHDLTDKRHYVPPDSVYGDFDIVLCRNVLIYYCLEYQDVIFSNLYRSLTRNGYLVLGETEAPTIEYQRYFKRLNPSCHIYQRLNSRRSK